MKVQFTTYPSYSTMVFAMEQFPDEDHSLLNNTYQGEVISNNRNMWGENFFLVQCEDGKIRECNVNEVTIL